ncbi:hypothetical protein QBC45DRAFT_446426 [Copromyces sp. CBS 386.78]|nr:hypothetical protein QBC45DRAFT_446426 [Copromyces sp. CBS 386.78]
MGILPKGKDVNYHGVIVQIWNSFSVNIKTILRAPPAFYDIESYLREIDQARAVLLAVARSKYASRTTTGNGYPSNNHDASRNRTRSRDRNSRDNRDRSRNRATKTSSRPERSEVRTSNSDRSMNPDRDYSRSRGFDRNRSRDYNVSKDRAHYIEVENLTEELINFAAHIDYRKAEVRLPQDNFSTAFEVFKPPNRCSRKVVTEKKVVLRPSEERMVPVHYVSLPKDRSFLFDSSHPAIVNAVLDARSPRVALMKNTTNETITVPRKQKIGMITEYNADGYFASSWSSIYDTAIAMQVLTNVEFNINLEYTATDDKAYTITEAPPTANPRSTAAQPNTPDTSASPDSVPHPKLPEKHSILGIRMDDKALEIITKEGVHIFAGSKRISKALAKLVERFLKLWKEGGLVDMPEDEMMRVPLVDGWQNHKVAARIYPISKKDQAVIDEVFDALYKQSKMDWVKYATPFAHPVFVVWRETKTGLKGRPVIDLRILNSLTIPDNYPLPLQGEIIAFMRGKIIVTIIDAISFFYQFGVWWRHRDRFTLIIHRGLEQPTVA